MLRGLECEHEGSAIRFKVFTDHSDEKVEGDEWRAGEGVASYHGVEHEGVWFGKMIEQLAGMAEVAGVG